MRMCLPGWQAVTCGAIVFVLAGCGDTTDSNAVPRSVAVQSAPISSPPPAENASSQPTRITTPLQPLSTDIADQVCSFHRYTTQADLIARFGDASAHEEEGGRVSMMWVKDNWRVVAFWTGGELQVAGASTSHPQLTNDLVALSEYPPELRIGETTQHEASALLGEGVQTAVSWHHGIDVDEQAAVRNGVPLRAIKDHCNRRFTFVGESSGRPMTLAFRDGILDGGFDDE